MIFVWCEPHILQDKWDLLVPGMRRVSNHSPGWRPEDFYCAIKNQQSVLHIAYEDGVYVGFVVTTKTADPTGPVLHVQAAYADTDLRKLHEDVMDNLRAWAQAIGARKVTFQTTRKGWEKYGEHMGWKHVSTVYECEV